MSVVFFNPHSSVYILYSVHSPNFNDRMLKCPMMRNPKTTINERISLWSLIDIAQHLWYPWVRPWKQENNYFTPLNISRTDAHSSTVLTETPCTSESRLQNEHSTPPRNPGYIAKNRRTPGKGLNTCSSKVRP